MLLDTDVILKKKSPKFMASSIAQLVRACGC